MGRLAAFLEFFRRKREPADVSYYKVTAGAGPDKRSQFSLDSAALQGPFNRLSRTQFELKRVFFVTMRNDPNARHKALLSIFSGLNFSPERIALLENAVELMINPGHVVSGNPDDRMLSVSLGLTPPERKLVEKIFLALTGKNRTLPGGRLVLEKFFGNAGAMIIRQELVRFPLVRRELLANAFCLEAQNKVGGPSSKGSQGLTEKEIKFVENLMKGDLARHLRAHSG